MGGNAPGQLPTPAPAGGEVVILVGMPGCGKTRYCREVFPGHVRISQDEGPRTFPKVLKLYQRLLEEGCPRIVIDRTNPFLQQRGQFVQLARQRGYRVRIVYFDVPRGVCEERIAGRQNHPTLGPEKMAEAMQHYLRCLTVPTKEECDDLVIVRG